ncbi:MAG: PEGA domain-containing protein [Sphaerochaeta sp.]
MGRHLALTMLCVFMLLSVFPLVAKEETPPYSVGIVSLDEGLSSLSELVASVSSRYGKICFPGDEELAYRYEQLQREKERIRIENLKRAYASYDEDRVEELRSLPAEEVIKPVSSYPVRYTEVPYDSHLGDAFKASDEALSWFADREGYDALLLLSSESLSDFQRVQVLYYVQATGEKFSLIDSLVKNAYYQELEESLSQAIFAATAKGNLGILSLSAIPVGLSVSVDGNQVDLIDSSLFLPPATYALTLEAPGYEPVSLEVTSKENTIRHLEFSFEEAQFPPSLLHSANGNVSWYVNGESKGEGLSLSLSDPTYPLVVIMEGESFSQKVVHLDSPVEQELTIALQYAQTSESSLHKDAQKDFYKRLRNTILWFSSYIGCTVLSQMYATGNPLWQVGMVATSSVALVSSIAMVSDFLSYEAMTGTGI